MKINLLEDIKLENEPLKIGQKAPEFCLAKLDGRTIDDVHLSDLGNKIKIISTFPSIDTGVCDLQTKLFYEKYKNNSSITIVNVSADLPFAFKKWCVNNNIDNLIMLSDYRDHSFAKAYGINIHGANLIYRSVIILDQNNNIVYTQYAKEIPTPLDFEDIEIALKNILN